MGYLGFSSPGYHSEVQGRSSGLRFIVVKGYLSGKNDGVGGLKWSKSILLGWCISFSSYDKNICYQYGGFLR